MAHLVHQFVEESAQRTPDAPALLCGEAIQTYAMLDDQVRRCAAGLAELGLRHDDRVAVYLPKRFETVVALFGAMVAGGVMVPVNPVLKAAQVQHILSDCAASVLVTTRQRLAGLAEQLTGETTLSHILVIDEAGDAATPPPAAMAVAPACHAWSSVIDDSTPVECRRIDQDIAAILYTSGSTGSPKGVVLSHRNLVAGAHSVASYLANTAGDRLLAALPFSFDYGFSQLTTAFCSGASVVLLDYLLPRHVIDAVVRHRITGLAAVPPLWNQLAELEWPDAAAKGLRYLTSSGGAIPRETTRRLRAKLPTTAIYLMYGLTEAFRSTYLDPQLVDHRPDSMGQAIPNAQIMVVRPDGSECDTDEPGELVHRGALVALGYWNAPAATAQRFRPAPGQPAGLPQVELAVWSGDTVRRDAAGLLYFVGRDDEMIKTSGYRVSPTEIEEVAFAIRGVEQAVALGVAHARLGQAIVLLLQARPGLLDQAHVLAHCRRALPSFMVPAMVVIESDLPRGANGKIDRRHLADRFAGAFAAEVAD